MAIPQSSSYNEKPLFIIFLDIDGVMLSEQDRIEALHHPSKEATEYAKRHEKYLHSNSNCYSNNYCSLIVAHNFSKNSLKNLDDLIKRVEVVARPQIVISSRWREMRSAKDLRDIFFGMHPFSGHIIGKTPWFDRKSGRIEKEESIWLWLNQRPEIENYIALDDEELESLKERFIGIDPQKLLSEDDVEKALAANALTAHLCKAKTASN